MDGNLCWIWISNVISSDYAITPYMRDSGPLLALPIISIPGYRKCVCVCAWVWRGADDSLDSWPTGVWDNLIFTLLENRGVAQTDIFPRGPPIQGVPLSLDLEHCLVKQQHIRVDWISHSFRSNRSVITIKMMGKHAHLKRSPYTHKVSNISALYLVYIESLNGRISISLLSFILIQGALWLLSNGNVSCCIEAAWDEMSLVYQRTVERPCISTKHIC